MKKDLMEKVRKTGGKYAIALSAPANHGKTSILKMFADQFRYGGATLIDMRPMGTGKDEMWCFESDGVRIGIATGGDDGGAVGQAFKFFMGNNCRIVFFATRYKSNSSSWRAACKLYDEGGYELDWQALTTRSFEVYKVIDRDISMNVLGAML